MRERILRGAKFVQEKERERQRVGHLKDRICSIHRVNVILSVREHVPWHEI